MIAGANGAGKTTFARQLLPAQHRGMRFLNADEIGREAPSFQHPMAAGRELLRRLDEAFDERASFAIETTLSSVMYAHRIPDWQAAGYWAILHFIEVPSADFAVARVAKRVAAGGHDIPEVDIRRRFERGLRLFSDVYAPMMNRWFHWRIDAEGLSLVEHVKR